MVEALCEKIRVNQTIKKWARGEEQKKERSLQILDAAAFLLQNKDYASITMQQVAEEAEIVKGTLYLYFKTKEELFLTLHQQEIEALLATWQTSVEEMKNSDQLPAISAEVFIQKPLSMRLVSITNQVLEHNISLEMAKTFKLVLHKKFELLAVCMEKKCSWMKVGQGEEFIIRFASYVIGLWSTTQPTPIIRELYEQTPELGGSHINFSKTLKNASNWLYQGMKNG